MDYSHTQHSPLHYLLHAIGVVILAVAWLSREEGQAVVVLCVVAAIMILCGLMFAQLTVRDEGEFLEIQFGPLPVFRRAIPYCDIASAEPSRSSIIDGWGVHMIPGRGWIYNLWGFDCVKLDVQGKTIRIGTDDVDGLLAFLRTKTSDSR